jgi:hypothetical protein
MGDGMKLAALIFAVFPLTANAYFGSYDPTPFRNKATIRFVDTPVPNLECAVRFSPFAAPIAATTMLGCVNGTLTEVVASITPSPFWAVVLAHGLTTPQAIIGHETRHIFDGFFHGALPFSDRLRYSDEDRRTLLSSQHGAEVLVERRGAENVVRVLGKDEERETDCVIFVRQERVSYYDLGVLIQECLK